MNLETIQTILFTIAIFFAIVTVHEWGHFYFAKRAGILVREFAIGFGPKLFEYRKDETLFTFRLLPIGGYVKMAGEDGETHLIDVGQIVGVHQSDNVIRTIYADGLEHKANIIRGEVTHVDLHTDLVLTLNVEGDVQVFDVHPQAIIVAKGQQVQIAPSNRLFSSKTVGQRALALFAGPAMNFVLAFFLFIVYVQMAGVPKAIAIDHVQQGTAAAQVHLHPGDVIQTINGTPIGGDVKKMLSLIAKAGEQQMEWTLVRNGSPVDVYITPVDGKAGIVLKMIHRSVMFPEQVKYAGIRMIDCSERIFKGFHHLLNHFSIKDVSGPVGMFEITGKVAKKGMSDLVHWTALLSLYLGIFNLLPIPALDGSRLVFLGIEAVRRKPLHPNREGMIHLIGFALFMLLMLAVTYQDIFRLLNK